MVVMNALTVKVCPKCGTERDPSQAYCKPCQREYARRYYRKNRAAIRQKWKAWSARNPDYYQNEKRKRYFREYQANKRNTDPTHWIKNAARSLASSAVKSGKIQKTPCVRCGALKVEAHHDDYYKPLDVKWVCRPCHGLYFSELPLTGERASFTTWLEQHSTAVTA